MPALAALALALLLVATAVASPSRTSGSPAHLDWEVVSRRAHDPEAFTQGLVLDTEGRLFESTGLLGRSTLREVDPQSGTVLRLVSLPDDHFGEGLAQVGDRLVQLTWRNGVAHLWEKDTFAQVATFHYAGEGWGLCFDGQRLVMSDGSERLTFRDAASFAVLGEVVVREAGDPLTGLNELECALGSVWANVWGTDRIVRIDPDGGQVTGSLDLGGVLLPHPRESRAGAVLNGLAYDAERDTLLVTGKLWPQLIEIRIHDPDQLSPAQPAKAARGSPATPTRAWNSPPASGWALRSSAPRCSHAVVMKRSSRVGPPKAQLETLEQGRGRMASSSPDGR
jgi:glutaminyl-peptide cyclotransferase